MTHSGSSASNNAAQGASSKSDRDTMRVLTSSSHVPQLPGIDEEEYASFRVRDASGLFPSAADLSQSTVESYAHILRAEYYPEDQNEQDWEMVVKAVMSRTQLSEQHARLTWVLDHEGYTYIG